MPLNPGVCQVWPTDFTTCHQIPDTLTEAQRTSYIRAASEYLFSVTGRRFGPGCPIVVRPCRKSCAEDFGLLSGRYLNQGQYRSTGGWIPYMRDGQMYNASLCGCRQDCHCGDEVCEIELVGPVYDIQSVRVDGHT